MKHYRVFGDRDKNGIVAFDVKHREDNGLFTVSVWQRNDPGERVDGRALAYAICAMLNSGKYNKKA